MTHSHIGCIDAYSIANKITHFPSRLLSAVMSYYFFSNIAYGNHPKLNCQFVYFTVNLLIGVICVTNYSYNYPLPMTINISNAVHRTAAC